jgi:transcriptional regulator with XRE-family HTH domain
MTDAKVVPLETTETPLDELPERERLGTQLKRLRLRANRSISELAMATDITEELLKEVEKFELPLNAEQLQSIAVALGVQWHPLLDLTRAFHRSVWKSDGKTGGVQLAEMDTKIGSMARPLDKEIEAMLVKAADDHLFMSNLLREAADRSLTHTLQIRTVLADRGVIEKDAPLELIDNPKVECTACHVVLDRNRENTARFEPSDGSDPMYFGSRECGEMFHEGGEFTCPRSGLPVVQTSAPTEDADGESGS